LALANQLPLPRLYSAAGRGTAAVSSAIEASDILTLDTFYPYTKFDDSSLVVPETSMQLPKFIKWVTSPDHPIFRDVLPFVG